MQAAADRRISYFFCLFSIMISATMIYDLPLNVITRKAGCMYHQSCGAIRSSIFNYFLGSRVTLKPSKGQHNVFLFLLSIITECRMSHRLTSGILLPYRVCVSNRRVTGPSLTEETFMSAPNSPHSTWNPRLRHSSLNFSYRGMAISGFAA